MFGACYELIAEWVRAAHIAGDGEAGGARGAGVRPSVDELVDEVVELATVILRLPRPEDADS